MGCHCLLQSQVAGSFYYYYYFLDYAGSCCCSSFSLVLRLLITATSLVVEQGHRGPWALAVVAPRLWSSGSIAEARGLDCSTTCEILLDRGLNQYLLPWRVGSLPLSHREAQSFLLNRCHNCIFTLHFHLCRCVCFTDCSSNQNLVCLPEKAWC